MVNDNSSNTLDNTILVKVVLTFLIVFYHSILFLNGHYFSAVTIEKYTIPSVLAEWLNSFHIYAFVFVSGYVFYFTKNEKNSYVNYGSFIKTKVKRLLIPYLVVSLVWAMPFDYLFYKGDFSFFFHKYLLGEGPSQLWFLLMLFWIFVFFYPLSNFFKKKWSIILCIVSYSSYLIGSKYIENYFQVLNFFRFLPFFFLGYFSRHYLDKFIKLVFSGFG